MRGDWHRLSPDWWPTLAEQRAATVVGRADCFIHILLGNVQYDGLGYRSPPYHEPLPQPRPKPKPRPWVVPQPPLPQTRVLLVPVVAVWAKTETLMRCARCGALVVWFSLPSGSWYPFDVFPFVTTEELDLRLIGYRDIQTLHLLTCPANGYSKRREAAMKTLRPELKPGDGTIRCMQGGTAYFMIYQAIQTQPGLIHGKLNSGQGEYCAIGSYFLINKTTLSWELIDEVAAVNDSMPGLTPRQRKTRVLQWLRWKLTTLGLSGRSVAPPPKSKK